MSLQKGGFSGFGDFRAFLSAEQFWADLPPKPGKYGDFPHHKIRAPLASIQPFKIPS